MENWALIIPDVTVCKILSAGKFAAATEVKKLPPDASFDVAIDPSNESFGTFFTLVSAISSSKLSTMIR